MRQFPASVCSISYRRVHRSEIDPTRFRSAKASTWKPVSVMRIQETINIAIIHVHNQNDVAAEELAQEILEIEPGHAEAENILAHVVALREGAAEAADDAPESLGTYDIEGVNPSAALNETPTEDEIPRAGAVPSFAEHEGGQASVEADPESFPTVAEERHRAKRASASMWTSPHSPVPAASYVAPEVPPPSGCSRGQDALRRFSKGGILASEGLLGCRSTVEEMLGKAPGHVFCPGAC